MTILHLNWLLDFGLIAGTALPFAYARLLDTIQKRTVGINVLYPRPERAEMTVYFWCSVTRKPSFTARATILSSFGPRPAQMSAKSAAKRPGARQIALPMIRMPFAEQPGFRTAGAIEIDRPDRRRSERVRVEILNAQGRAIRSCTRRIVWADATSDPALRVRR